MREHICSSLKLHGAPLIRRSVHGKAILMVPRPDAEREPDLLQIIDAIDPNRLATASRPRWQQEDKEKTDHQHDDHQLQAL